MYIYTLLTLNYILEPAWENSIQRSEDNFEVEYVCVWGWLVWHHPFLH